jgi:RNA polymerase sigma-70 factor (ECF subfamily)
MRPELIQAAELLQRDTPEAVEEALGLLQSTIYSFSMKVCGHPEDAEDNMQEVLYRSLKHLAKIQNPQALAVWLYTVTRNRCWRMRRKVAGAPQQTVSLDELMPDEMELGRLLKDASQGPEGNVLEAEQKLFLHHAILRIPPALRIALVLHDMEELTTEQVAQILDLQQGTVRIRLHRARLAVRKEMSQMLDAAEPANHNGTKEKKQKRAESKNGKRPAECSDLFANLSEYLDGRIEPVSCDQMRIHIEACPSCVAFLHSLRSAIDRCRSLEMPCDPAVAGRLRAILTREYLRMLMMPDEKKAHAAV